MSKVFLDKYGSVKRFYCCIWKDLLRTDVENDLHYKRSMEFYLKYYGVPFTPIFFKRLREKLGSRRVIMISIFGYKKETEDDNYFPDIICIASLICIWEDFILFH